MNSEYDMCNDYDTLCLLENKFRNIKTNIGNSADSMLYALRNAGEFLSGNQYEKASNVTIQCSYTSRYTIENIDEVLKYIANLKNCIEEYSGCGFER